MGDEHGDLWDDCRPVHKVKITPFYMGKYPVTQRLWQSVMGNNPAHFKGERRPVERVSWDDAQQFLKKLNAQPDVARHLRELRLAPRGEGFRLPTEAEWEYVARGGRHIQGYRYAGSDDLAQVAWYDKNSDRQTHEVGLLLPNELGLHDMSGNIWEWCNDRWGGKEYYELCKKQGTVPDPPGPERGGGRMRRGGSFFLGPLSCRPACRNGNPPGERGLNLGFRLALPFQSEG
jgi:formylglycine-generating enzyme required for sulfatase activity